MATREELKNVTTFRAVCKCGKKSPRWVSAWTTAQWMNRHENEHRAAPVGVREDTEK